MGRRACAFRYDGKSVRETFHGQSRTLRDLLPYVFLAQAWNMLHMLMHRSVPIVVKIAVKP